ncbi:MAG: ATP-dependent Clp protease ATP-binding subunit [bacterium]|nr:ATP-dependent Clp protease ATP-binding subunit [bacterium]
MGVVSFIDCPQCHGYGFNITPSGKHVSCTLCEGDQSTFGFIENDSIYWDKEISVDRVKQKKIEKFFDRLIDTVLLIIAVAGIIALVVAMFNFYQTEKYFYGVFGDQSGLMLLFWLTIINDILLYYRIERHRKPAPTILRENILANVSITGDVGDWNYWKGMSSKQKIEISKYFKPDALIALDKSFTKAAQLGHTEVRPIHLLISMAESTELRSVLLRLEIDLNDLIDALGRIAIKMQEQASASTEVSRGADFVKTLMYAYSEARINERPAVAQVELMVGCILSNKLIEDAFYDRSVDINKVRNLVYWSNLVEDIIEKEKNRKKMSRSKPKGIMNRAMTARPTDKLDAVSQDFTAVAKANGYLPPIGRSKEIEEAFRVLQQSTNSVLLVGPSGVGKSTILQGIARLMSAEDVPKELQDMRFVVTDPSAIIAGASDIGGIELRMQQIIGDIIMAGNVIWGLEDIHTLLGAGSTGSSIDIGKILMNYISQGYLRVIGTTTTQEFQQYIEPQETFLRRFQVVQIPELEPADAIIVLEGRAPFIEAKHQVFFTYDALEACVNLSDRFIKNRHLPSKAIDIMEESAVYVKEKLGAQSLVTKQAIQQVMSEKTNVAVSSISDDEASRLLNLEEILHHKVIGQNAAIVAIARSLRRASQDIRDANRPISSLLFLGPTGVGKTETAKAIAATYFGNEQNMMRFDMSEYDSQGSIQKLIGGAGKPGLLTDAIKRTPFGIVLLDELEKAHPDVLNLFLQVMEDGRLTDGTGRVNDFTNAMIIATSNSGTNAIQNAYKEGQNSEQIKRQLIEGDLLKDSFRPEFLNRFDDIVVFTPLSEIELMQVCDLLLRKLAKQLEEKGVSLQWTEDALRDLAKRGYDPIFGARPLRRLIQDTTQDAIAKLLLSKELGRRDIVELQPGGEVRVIKADQV